MNLVIPPGVDESYIRAMFADEETIRAAYWQPRAGDAVMDIGSHHGSYTIPALAEGADVIAVEPHRHHSDVMLAILAASGISTDRLTVISQPLTGPDGYSEEFWQHLAESPNQSIYATRDMAFTTLDDLALDLGLIHLDWVKMDVEGAELGILQGGLSTLRSFRPFLLIEDHGEPYPWVADMGIPGQCLELLRGIGYQPEIVRLLHEPSGNFRNYWICRRSGDG